MNRRIWPVLLVLLLLVACGPVDLNAPAPVFETGVDPDAWATVPAGPFLYGQHEDVVELPAYEIMVTDVTVAQYAAYLNEALAAGAIKIKDDAVVGFYPGDVFRGVKHEERIDPGDYLHVPLTDPSLKLTFDGRTFAPKAGWENHPMTMVTWFGARAYCDFHGWRLPTAEEWEKAARGTDGRPFPWGEEITRNHANFYASRDPFEDMSSFGSRTTPVGFYNGRTYNGYATRNAVSPYGLYDMAGNVWQWLGDVYEGQHYRYMAGGSKDTYEMDLRAWVRNNATPTYFSPGVGFRCAR